MAFPAGSAYSSGDRANAGAYSDRQFNVYLALSQYPVLAERIRLRMRRELFERGIISKSQFEGEVRTQAIHSQAREGLRNPLNEEPPEIWEYRLARLRELLTDQLFSQYLSFELFEQLVWEVLSEHGVETERLSLSMNPELAPLEMVFEQALSIEKLPYAERLSMEARLKESKVVLIRTMISDQLRYINVAKEWFTIEDLMEIRRRKLGTGRIGGKSAGMLLAMRVLDHSNDPDLKGCLSVPDSYFIGSDVFYTFLSINNLVHWNDQKYKTEDEMRADFSQIEREFESGVFPQDFLDELGTLLSQVESRPVIVRSSSLLEDNFGTSFAGKYESVFCPNQGNHDENLRALTRAITRVYSSTLNPNALLYRRSKGLQDYDERMAILIQVVEGRQFGHYFLPDAAGVAFSRNLYRWAPQIRRDDGFMRLVWGLGTRAVDRVGNDYPRLVALSHPLLRPSTDPTSIRRYSQQYVDLIDLKENEFRTLPIHDVLESDYPPLRYLAQTEADGYYSSLRSRFIEGGVKNLVLTFEDLLKRTSFASKMNRMLNTLEDKYNSPVDMEFTVQVRDPNSIKPEICITILQCRPQSFLITSEQAKLPLNLNPQDIIFSTRFVVPEGTITGVDYVLYVPPDEYFALPSYEARARLVRTISRLNAALKDECFICIGPGRWGSSNSDLGVSVDYGDIYNTKALVELAGKGIGPAPEPSLGTHFFQDLIEQQIYPLAIYLDDPQSVFLGEFFHNMPNHAQDWIPIDERIRDSLHLIKVEDYRPGHSISIVMSDEKSRAVAFLEPNDEDQ